MVSSSSCLLLTISWLSTPLPNTFFRSTPYLTRSPSPSTVSVFNSRAGWWATEKNRSSVCKNKTRPKKKKRQDRNISLLTNTTGHSTGIYWALGWVVGTGLGYQTAVCGLATILSSSFPTFVSHSLRRCDVFDHSCTFRCSVISPIRLQLQHGYDAGTGRKRGRGWLCLDGCTCVSCLPVSA